MSEEAADTDLEKWKEKYLNLADQAEQAEQRWQSIHDTLCETINKVSVAAKGLDEGLDRQLDAVQALIRSEYEPEALLQKAEEFGQFLKILDDEKSKKTCQLLYCFEKLLTPLTQYNLPDSHKGIVNKINKLIHEPEAVDHFDEIIEGYITVLNGLPQLILASENFSKPEATFWQKIIAAIEAQLVEYGWLQPPPRSASNDVAKQSSINLVELLDLLAKNQRFRKEANMLRERLLDGLQIDQLPEILRGIVDMVSQLFHVEYRRIEKFLEKFTLRFTEVENSIVNIMEVDQLSEEQNQYLNEEVCNNIEDIKIYFSEAESIEKLESMVTSKLDRMVECMGEYKKNGEKRLESIKQQLDQLKQKLESSESDIQYLEKELQEEKFIAEHDPLTQLFNRLAYEQVMKEIFEDDGATPLTLVVIDVDHFKKINDQYGHLAGDKVLKKISQLLETGFEGARIVARYGGEEFVALFLDQALPDIKEVTEKLRHQIEHCGFHFQGQPVKITASFGIAARDGHETPDLLFEMADQALYRAKKAGRNRIVMS